VEIAFVKKRRCYEAAGFESGGNETVSLYIDLGIVIHITARIYSDRHIKRNNTKSNYRQLPSLPLHATSILHSMIILLD
jgi:hypothetical protein